MADGVAREGPFEEVTFEGTPEGHVQNWVRGKHSGQKEHQCKGPEMGINQLDFEPEPESQSEGGQRSRQGLDHRRPRKVRPEG